MFGPMGVPEFVILPLILLGSLFWIWMLIDCAMKCPVDKKVIWIVVIVLGNFLGAAAYFLMERQREQGTLSKS